MATGSNIQPRRGIQTSAVTPGADFDTGESQVWGALGKIAQEAEARAKPAMERRARQRGAEEGAAVAAGEMPKPERGLLFFGDMAEAHTAAFKDAYVAGLANDADAREGEVRLRNLHNLEGYDQEMAQVRTGFIQGALPEYAVDVEAYINRRMTIGRADIAQNVNVVALRQADGALVARINHLQERALELIDSGQGRTIEYEIITDELERQYAARADNPALPYSREEADGALREFTGRAKAAGIVSNIRDVLRTEGADAAYEALEAILQGGSFLSPSAGAPEGLVARGNIDLADRPTVENGDGSVSTVRSISIEIEGQTVLIPTVTEDGRVVDDDEAAQIYHDTGRHLGIFNSSQAADAYAVVLHGDQESGRVGGLGMTGAERQLAFNAARAAINDELGLTNQRRAQADSERSQRVQEVSRLVDEDIAGIELNGSGTGLNAEQVRELGGTPAVSAWLKRRAEAQEFHGLVGSLPLNDPDAAAAQIARAASQRGLGALPVVQDEGDLATLARAIETVESSGVNGLVSADPDGDGPARGGAQGLMQVLPATARTIAGELGLPFDENRLRTDAAYNRQIGTRYLQNMLTRYNGDSFLAVTAYHAGPGNVDSWLRSVGDPRTGQISREAWLQGVESRGARLSAAYPRKVLAAMAGGQANAAWDSYQGRRTEQQTDPAKSVLSDFAVQTAAERWRESPGSVPAAEGMVSATMDAQERAGIAAGSRRTLPLNNLIIYAGQVEAYARAGDTENFAIFQRQVIRTFGRHGERVMQDVLEVRGNSRYAAMLSARMATQAARGQRPAPAEVEQAGRAATTNTMARSAAGTSQPASAMTDEQVLAAAGLSQ